jgi:hypothetical protein
LIVLLTSLYHSTCAKSSDWNPLIEHILTWFEFGLEKLTDELHSELDQHLDTEYPKWKNLKTLKKEHALKKLTNSKEEVKKIIKSNEELFEKITAKSEIYIKIIKHSPKILKGGGTLFINYAISIGIAADLAQAGLEYAGHETAGKGVGAAGNALSGAAIGAPFGPIGMFVGAMGGLAFWGFGELTNDLIENKSEL